MQLQTSGAIPMPPDQLVQISAGSLYACGVTTTNRVKCWVRCPTAPFAVLTLLRSQGDDNSFGKVVNVPDAKFLSVATGVDHTCGILYVAFSLCYLRFQCHVACAA